MVPQCIYWYDQWLGEQAIASSPSDVIRAKSAILTRRARHVKDWPVNFVQDAHR